MTLQELSQLVSLGEGPSLEFKRKVPKAERIAKEVIAFANTRGGRLLLGVDDDGAITGVRDAEEEEFALRQALNAHCDPPVEFDTERVPVTAKRDVILVSVPESAAKPHFLVGHQNGNDPGAYVRVEDMSVEASKEAVRIMRAEKKESNVLFEFGDKEQMLMRYLEAYGRITVEQFATLAHISNRLASQTLVILTRANVLRLHADPKQDFFTLAYDVS
jgi:predicted HTH transcriptional regulator